MDIDVFVLNIFKWTSETHIIGQILTFSDRRKIISVGQTPKYVWKSMCLFFKRGRWDFMGTLYNKWTSFFFQSISMASIYWNGLYNIKNLFLMLDICTEISSLLIHYCIFAILTLFTNKITYQKMWIKVGLNSIMLYCTLKLFRKIL